MSNGAKKMKRLSANYASGNLALGLYGFGLAVAYLPATVGGALAPRWILAAIASWLLLLPSQVPSPSWRVWPLAAFVFWFCLSSYWSPSPLDAGNGLLELGVASGSFLLGLTLENERPFYIGLGLGIVPAWLFGWFDPNFDLVGEAAGLAAVGLGTFASPLAVIPWAIVLLGHSKGAILGGFVAIGLGNFSLGVRRVTWLCIVSGIGAALLGVKVFSQGSASIAERWDIWRDTWAGVTWFGHGVGSLWTVFPFYASHQDVVARAAPLQAHNDFLQVGFEQGIIGVALGAVAFGCLLWGRWQTRPGLVLIALCAMAMVGFPFHMPVTLVVGAIAIGGLCRRDSLQCAVWDGRIPFISDVSRPMGYGGRRAF